MPEGQYEIIEGRVVHVAPADEPHGTRHAKLAALLEAHAGDGYEVACDMLTRTSVKGDMAPDASVFPEARDPSTGGRQVEDIAFEIVSTERLSHTAKKARALTERGVRRVLAIDLHKRRVLSWSESDQEWQELPPGSFLEDRALAVPLPLDALLDTARADDAVASALLRRKNPILEEEGSRREALGEARGSLEGKMAALLAILSARKLPASKETEQRLRKTATASKLDGWLARALSVSSPEELLQD